MKANCEVDVYDYKGQVAEADNLNEGNKLSDVFYTIAPIDAHLRYAYIERLLLRSPIRGYYGKKPHSDEETAVYKVRIAHYEDSSNMIFTRLTPDTHTWAQQAA